MNLSTIRFAFVAFLAGIVSCVHANAAPLAWGHAFGRRAEPALVERWDARIDRVNHWQALALAGEDFVRHESGPITPKTRELLLAAKTYALQATDCPSCILWKEIRASLNDLDVAVTIKAFRTKEASEIASYFFYSDTLFVEEEDVVSFTTPQLSTILLHEMTHRAVWKTGQARMSCTPVEWLGVSMLCSDVAARWKLATEAVAYFNQLRFADRLNVSQLKVINLDALRWALKPIGSEPEVNAARKKFASWILQAISVKDSQKPCGPPVIVRGPHGGTYFDPEAFAPDLLHPLFAVAFGDP